MNCVCGRKMVTVLDTLVCPVCDNNVVFELNSYVKYDIEEIDKP